MKLMGKTSTNSQAKLQIVDVFGHDWTGQEAEAEAKDEMDVEKEDGDPGKGGIISKHKVTTGRHIFFPKL